MSRHVFLLRVIEKLRIKEKIAVNLGEPVNELLLEYLIGFKSEKSMSQGVFYSIIS